MSGAPVEEMKEEYNGDKISPETKSDEFDI